MEIKVRIDISARHVHLTRESADALFGAGYELTEKKKIAVGALANERLTVIGPKGRIENVAILLPLRPETQVELAMTDAFKLGVKAPVRLSGDVAGAAPLTLAGPAGTLELGEGAIVAKRHVHIGPERAAACGLTNADTVQVRVETEERSLIFDDVAVRICKPGKNEEVPSVHIDTDEGNAAGISGWIEAVMLVPEKP